MSSVQTTSLGWQLDQFQQRISERLELMVRKLSDNVSDLPLPSGLAADILILIVKILFWLMVAGLLIWIILPIQRWIRSYLKYQRRKLKNQPASRKVNSDVTEWSIAHWLKQAQKLQNQENYREACQCLYQAMLQQLHNRDMILHQVSRTDGEYWQLIQQFNRPQPYQQLLQIHQELCFGNVPASFSLLETCWNAYGEIEQT